VLAWIEGDLPGARALLERAVGVCREGGERWGAAYSLTYLGLVVVCQGEATAARDMSEESVALFREEMDVWGIALALSNLGRVAYEQGDLEAADVAIEESLGLFREIGDMWGRGRALHTLGEVARLQGDFEKARLLNEECLEVYRALDHKIGKAWALHNLAYAALHARDAPLAAEMFKESLSLYHEQGDKQGIAMCLVGISGTLTTQPGMRNEYAAQLLGAAQAMFEDIGAYLWRADRIEYDRCMAAARQGLSEQAFEAALSEGRAMTPDQAVALAREGASLSNEPAAAGSTRAAQPTSPDATGELTKRELEVLRLVAAGLPSAEVASRLFLSPHTVHAHLHSIYSKLGVTTRSAATHLAASRGLL
jgi:ATP/maltotriose-dependent transcriptional regulator MalT